MHCCDLSLNGIHKSNDNMSGWCCPHEQTGLCVKVNNTTCKPGMKGCVLQGRFQWADAVKVKKEEPVGSEETSRKKE